MYLKYINKEVSDVSGIWGIRGRCDNRASSFVGISSGLFTSDMSTKILKAQRTAKMVRRYREDSIS